MLLVPALARTQPDSRAARCLNNHRQLCRAWRMYADDNNERFPTTSSMGTPATPVWAGGWLDWGTSSDNTNTLYLADPRYSALAPYCGKDARLFKCPADQYISAMQRARRWKERARSISENIWVGENNLVSSDPSYTVVKKWTDLLNPKPVETWVSLDEHPDSINDGAFYAPGTSAWVDLPANYHDGGAGVAFADGHSEIHRWQSSVLKVPVTFRVFSSTGAPNDPDIRWLRDRTPRKPGVN
jgi:prepilin-type processing-associated H-X9-DG protein